ncbi:MAG: MFS transporter [Clostridiaceae bacterium]
MEIKEKRQVKRKNMIAYGIGDIYGGGAFLIISTLFLNFLTDTAFIAPILAGTIIAIGKVWDAITDPVMGYISDHTKSKYGRRRVYFLIGMIPIAVSFILLWLPMNFENNFAYYLIVYLLFNTVFTMVMVPYNTISAEMTNDYTIRSKMTGNRMFFSQLAGLFGSIIPLKIIDAYPNSSTGYIVMAVIFGLLFASPWIIVYKGTWENKDVKVSKSENFKSDVINIFKEFGSSFRNKSFRVHIIMYLGAYVAMDILLAVLLYFVTDYLNMRNVYTLTLAIVFITQIISLTWVTKLTSRKGNAFTYKLCLIIWAIGIIALSFVKPESSKYLVFILAVVIGAGQSGAVMIPYNILPFVTDVDEMITGRRREGVYAGQMTLIRKISQAIALFTVGAILSAIGYKPNIVLSNYTLEGIRNIVCFGPIILIILGLSASFKFKVNPKNHKILIDEVERLKNGGLKKDVSEESRKVCEELTGIEYKNLWEC